MTADDQVGTRGSRQPKNQRLEHLFHALIGNAKIVVGCLTALGVIVGSYLAADAWIDHKLTTPETLHRISERVMPSLIFDANERIIEDMGATALIADNGKGIHLTKEKDGWPSHIRIEFTRRLEHPPRVTSMYEITVIIPERSKGFAWEFPVQEVIARGTVASNYWTYRLQIDP